MKTLFLNQWVEKIPLYAVAPAYDAIAMIFAGYLAWSMRFGQMELRERYTLAISVMVLLIWMLNSYGDNYARWQKKRLGHLIFNLFLVWVAATLIISSMLFFLDFSSEYSRLWIISALWISFFLSIAGRIAARVWLAKYRLSGAARRKIFLVGPGHVLLATARHMRREQSAGYSIAGYQRMKADPVQRELDHLARRVEATRAEEVWICMPLNMGDTIKEITFTLRHLTADIRFFPELSDLPLLNHRVSEVVGLYSIDLSTSPMLGKARLAKRLEDFWIGFVICMLIAPVCLVIILAIKLTSPGPAIFKQYRTGINGKRFKVYKFRSMRIHQEHEGQVTQAMKGDSRITPVGAFLRKTSLDELPQFFNVLQGRMSIVGPRPHALAHNEHYKALVESYMKRHKVKPGITGWAQVSGYRGETDTLEKMQMRVKFDLWYIENWSLALDVKIIFLTFFKGFIGKNAY